MTAVVLPSPSIHYIHHAAEGDLQSLAFDRTTEIRLVESHDPQLQQQQDQPLEEGMDDNTAMDTASNTTSIDEAMKEILLNEQDDAADANDDHDNDDNETLTTATIGRELDESMDSAASADVPLAAVIEQDHEEVKVKDDQALETATTTVVQQESSRQPTAAKQEHRSKHESRFGGLSNLGNTCYMNSALQMLASSETFIDMLRQHENDSRLRRSFLNVMDRLAAGETISPNDFKNAVDEATPLFVGYRQQDAHEFLTTLLDLLDEDYKKKEETKEEDKKDETLPPVETKVVDTTEVEKSDETVQVEKSDDETVQVDKSHDETVQVDKSHDETVLVEKSDDETVLVEKNHGEATQNDQQTVQESLPEHTISQEVEDDTTEVEMNDKTVQGENDLPKKDKQQTVQEDMPEPMISQEVVESSCILPEAEDEQRRNGSATKRPRTEEPVEVDSCPAIVTSPSTRLSLAQLGMEEIGHLLHGTSPIDATCQDNPAAPEPSSPRYKLIGGRMSSADVLNERISPQVVESDDSALAARESAAKEEEDASTSPVSSYFTTQIRVRLTCDSCKYTRFHEETFLHLSLEMGSETGCTTVEEGLRRFFSPERRELKCERCFCATATQTSEIVKLPRALLLHFKRFLVDIHPDYSITYRKNHSAVAFDRTLQDQGILSEFTAAASYDMMSSSQQHKYELKSVVHHMGSSASCGHYTADGVRPPDHQWMRFNDSYISPIMDRSSLSPSTTAYIVMYEQQQQQQSSLSYK